MHFKWKFGDVIAAPPSHPSVQPLGYLTPILLLLDGTTCSPRLSPQTCACDLGALFSWSSDSCRGRHVTKSGPMGILPRDWCIYTEKDPLPTRISEPRACDPEQPATISTAAGGNVNFLQSRGGPTWEAKIVSVGVPTTSFQHLGPALPEVRIHS